MALPYIQTKNAVTILGICETILQIELFFIKASCKSDLKAKFCRFFKIKCKLLSFSTFKSCFYQPTCSLFSAKTGRMFAYFNLIIIAVLFFLMFFFGFDSASFKTFF